MCYDCLWSHIFSRFFCYVCGEFFAKRAKNTIGTTPLVQEKYLAYFIMPVGVTIRPHVICDYCRRTLEDCLRREKRTMRFVIPRIWREPSDHHTNCYFCMMDSTKRRKGKNAPPIEYPDILSSIALFSL